VTVPDHVVYVVDDDASVREALEQLLLSADRNAVSFASTAEYLGFPKPDLPACLVLDVKLPDADGLDFQGRVAAIHQVPVVFITGYGDIPSSVRAIKAGAVDFLTKPFSERQMLDAIDAAIALDRRERQARAELAHLWQKYALLTPRERDVFPLVARGLLNKQSAAMLGISEVTLQIHRSKVMQKMEARSLADLVRSAERLGLLSDDGKVGEGGPDAGEESREQGRSAK
jgi:FixJ family two-component response regulator